MQCTSCSVFYTGKDKITAEVTEAIDSLPHIALYNGRPDLSAILAWLVIKRSVKLRKLLNARNSCQTPRRGSFMGSLKIAPAADAVLSTDSSPRRNSLLGGRAGRKARLSKEQEADQDVLSETQMAMPTDLKEFKQRPAAYVQVSAIRPRTHACHLPCSSARPCVRLCISPPPMRRSSAAST